MFVGPVRCPHASSSRLLLTSTPGSSPVPPPPNHEYTGSPLLELMVDMGRCPRPASKSPACRGLSLGENSPARRGERGERGDCGGDRAARMPFSREAFCWSSDCERGVDGRLKRDAAVTARAREWNEPGVRDALGRGGKSWLTVRGGMCRADVGALKVERAGAGHGVDAVR